MRSYLAAGCLAGVACASGVHVAVFSPRVEALTTTLASLCESSSALGSLNVHIVVPDAASAVSVERSLSTVCRGASFTARSLRDVQLDVERTLGFVSSAQGREAYDELRAFAPALSEYEGVDRLLVLDDTTILLQDPAVLVGAPLAVGAVMLAGCEFWTARGEDGALTPSASVVVGDVPELGASSTLDGASRAWHAGVLTMDVAAWSQLEIARSFAGAGGGALARMRAATLGRVQCWEDSTAGRASPILNGLGPVTPADLERASVDLESAVALHFDEHGHGGAPWDERSPFHAFYSQFELGSAASVAAVAADLAASPEFDTAMDKLFAGLDTMSPPRRGGRETAATTRELVVDVYSYSMAYSYYSYYSYEAITNALVVTTTLGMRCLTKALGLPRSTFTNGITYHELSNTASMVGHVGRGMGSASCSKLGEKFAANTITLAKFNKLSAIVCNLQIKGGVFGPIGYKTATKSDSRRRLADDDASTFNETEQEKLGLDDEEQDTLVGADDTMDTEIVFVSTITEDIDDYLDTEDEVTSELAELLAEAEADLSLELLLGCNNTCVEFTSVEISLKEVLIDDVPSGVPSPVPTSYPVPAPTSHGDELFYQQICEDKIVHYGNKFTQFYCA